MSNKKIVLTGIKPTGEIHLGNLLGAIKPALDLTRDQSYTHYLFVADYHALSVARDPVELKKLSLSVAASWLAFGLDPKQVIFYRQSDVPEIMEINWILTCMTSKGLMNRAHAYKALVQENEQAGREDIDHNIGMGIYSYPILMAADILAFDADLVPVGKDQLQHIEIARDIAQRFNHHYDKSGVGLKLPTALTQTAGSFIVGLDGRKMSKSYGNTIGVFENEKRLRKLVMKIQTDSTPPEAPKDPSQSHIFDIFKAVATPSETSELERRYHAGIAWGEAKQVLFEKLNEFLRSPREEYNRLMNEPTEIEQLLHEGSIKARVKACEVLDRLKKLIGISF